MNETVDEYLRDVVSYGQDLSPSMFIIVEFLLATVFCHYKYLCENLHPYGHIHATHCFMVPPPDFLYDYTYNLPWDDKSKKSSLTGIQPFICLTTKMDSLLTSQGSLAAQVNESLKTGLDEQNIGGT